MEIDLDVSELVVVDHMVVAFETDDEIGCVLRLHLAFERLVEFYIKHSASPEQIKFIEKTNEFSEKLKRAVLLGIPLNIAEVGKQLGKIRNKVAHEQKPINRHQLENLIVLVDRMLLGSPSYEPLSKRKLQLFSKKTGEVIVLGSHGDVYDFIITAGAAYHGAMMIIIQAVALKKAAKKSYKSQFNGY
ncbi:MULTISPECIES: hypothetical protein [Pseudomonas syringae group]|uniref:DUF4145 domain-containing protein n=4 Tax=Pseudomonas syringae group TaxID=136849 RepID=F3G5L8_PSESJ|nr:MULTISPECIES: hypothetical protein [Pseudomonas syringae group]EGH42368.1 hypothetical protein PSYPI_08070 [Pseudomonas syringae pv. pisi str. 1704B]RMU67569.1 hypothetical protein ALP24_03526 [Pseudomonas syringae pv. aptata]PYD13448.1 hypothetical protein DND62_11380 [Pseudomonas syringae pv. pisi]PYD30855.1 hypothetical protein DND58_13595 [Pseudomonas syringae pv. pisi]PYD34636.1 hypothetical protein DND67_08795 [Pseudomonas syringae pv. pisi]